MTALPRTRAPAIDHRPILYVTGLLLVALAVAMLVPAWADVLDRDPDYRIFLTCAAITSTVGGMLVLGTRGRIGSATLREGFLLTVGCWLGAAAFGALPLALSNVGISYTDAFFEAMSGITTTGSTVLVGLEDLPKGILLWRAILQWLGGVGFVVMAIAVLPWLRTGGMQLFRAESSDRSDKPMPRLAEVTSALCLIYIGLSALCALAYWHAGMTPFQAIAHAMTTLSTAGYSTSDLSFAAFSPAAQWVGVLFMIIGAMPLLLFVRLTRGDWSILYDRQVRVMLLVLWSTVAVLTIWLWSEGGRSLHDALRHVAFNVTSIMTTTGFASDDYGLWGPFAVGVFFYLTFIGGCTGSTAGGIKIFRLRVLLIVLDEYIYRRFLPHALLSRTYDDKPLTIDVVEGVLAFIVVYALSVALIALALGTFDLDWLTAVSSAAQAVGNVGPGLGPIVGPAGNFSSLPDGAKWLLAFGMLLGRLELFTVLVLFVPRFWRS